MPGSVLSSDFGWRIHPITHKRQFHNGVDLAAALGTPIRAATEGKVTLIPEDKSGGYGNLLIINREDGYKTFYGHSSRYLVADGQQVKPGESIALVGSTGISTGPHLHFEVRYKDCPLDPKGFITVA